ncbi:hypothetical protein ACM72X_23480 [Pseudomonas aeruginosa]|jgi:hypothetical protein|uniref:hypothetical protein n=1 Tax=Pseudomonas aeruginosa TaxID=287 RepID=UPI000A348193|nr:hypothetical protein [Pseudomonas aeruginosa]MBV5843180.1 hypothetical protein [Pseudomonas aeruginosa]MDY1121773.1 hypothetical protein [Pseudomonas aeruginosa]OTI18679.1 hypothetical protein CAY89_22110 [Pseudomonas aeruginosa]OTI37254.1 hypothetical protein CAY97_21035 [Pseudomonas aeruginosa]OTI43409.1 hypothetical protein CAZ18_21330 [Pseudomonas aeruginosa]
MKLSRGKVAEMVWWTGLAVSLAGCLLMLAQVLFEAVPVGQRWPAHTLMLGAVLVAFAKVIESHTRSSASRVVRDALTKAKR